MTRNIEIERLSIVLPANLFTGFLEWAGSRFYGLYLLHGLGIPLESRHAYARSRGKPVFERVEAAPAASLTQS